MRQERAKRHVHFTSHQKSRCFFSICNGDNGRVYIKVCLPSNVIISLYCSRRIFIKQNHFRTYPVIDLCSDSEFNSSHRNVTVMLMAPISIVHVRAMVRCTYLKQTMNMYSVFYAFYERFCLSMQRFRTCLHFTELLFHLHKSISECLVLLDQLLHLLIQVPPCCQRIRCPGNRCYCCNAQA